MKNTLLFLRRTVPAIFMFALAAFAFGERACAENAPKAVLSEENKKSCRISKSILTALNPSKAIFPKFPPPALLQKEKSTS